uniref:Uncharacterized protein n=1 Tax=Lactuca sativa TaxID=4236 RepID=A0A9R1WT19_LACSA|nr:hypothetical protein LSAT_V11C100021700 [Lactuca sativa]
MISTVGLVTLVASKSRSKSDVVHVEPIVDVDEFVNDETKLMMVVDDGNIIPHGEPVEHFQNKANSIETVIQAVFPNTCHGLCCRHLLMNMRAKIDKQERKKILFWEATKAYREYDFKESLGRLRRVLNDDRRTLLDIIGNERWERSCFPVGWYNLMISNSAESVNALSRDARKLPITMLIDFF